MITIISLITWPQQEEVCLWYPILRTLPYCDTCWLCEGDPLQKVDGIITCLKYLHDITKPLARKLNAGCICLFQQDNGPNQTQWFQEG